LRSEVQPAQTNASTPNLVNSSNPIQTRVSAILNNSDIGLYPKSTKALKDDRKYTLLANAIIHTTWIRFQKGCQWSACFHGEFSLRC